MGKIKEFFKFLPYDIWYGIKNIFLFLPTIWRFRTWDVDDGVILLIKRALEVTRKEIPSLIEYYNKEGAPFLGEDLKETQADIDEILEIIDSRFFNSSATPTDEDYKKLFELLAEKLPRMWFP